MPASPMSSPERLSEIPIASSTPSSHVPSLTSTRMDVVELLQLAIERGASDLHLAVGAPPVVRIHGELVRTDRPQLTREDSKRLVYSLLTDTQKAHFEREQELDFSIAIEGLGRFRVNVHYQRGSIEAAFRIVPLRIRTLEELGLPGVVAELTRKPNGLVLVTGPTGVGKTTTLAAMIDRINHERSALIIVIEDPIEYIFQHGRSIVKQREVYSDTKSFAEALRRSLRQDPNVIVVGEMRDLETIATALTAAETGHLVLATLHTPDAPQTIDRIIDVFPPYQQQQVKIQLADCLQGVVSQQLLPRVDEPGRVVACEIMMATPAVRHLIREHATEQLPTVIQTGGQHGMCTMDYSLKALYHQGRISYETAVSRAKHSDEIGPTATPPSKGFLKRRR